MSKPIMGGMVLTALTVCSLYAADVPRPAKEFQVRMTDGKDFALSSLKGKVVAVEFLLTTCSHCQRASQTMNKLQRELGAQGFQPVGVGVNDMANMLVEDYVKQFNLGFPVGWSLRDPVIAFLEHPVMMMMNFPQIVIIDRKGVIRHQIAGGDEFFVNEEKNMRELLLPLLKEGTSKPATKAKAPPKKAS